MDKNSLPKTLFLLLSSLMFCAMPLPFVSTIDFVLGYTICFLGTVTVNLVGEFAKIPSAEAASEDT